MTARALLAEVVRLLRVLAQRQQLVVGAAGAAQLLNTSEDKVRELVRAGLISTVDGLSTSSKLAISVRELDRFAAVNAGATAVRLQAVGS